MAVNSLILPWLLCAFTGAVLAATLPPDASPAARTPAGELASFRLADPQLTVELVAAEPNVVSSVCIAWDADQRLFVVEMSDYPNASDKGRVKLIEDRDGDGRHERVTVFAEGLPFPTSSLPWNGGVLEPHLPSRWKTPNAAKMDAGIAHHL